MIIPCFIITVFSDLIGKMDKYLKFVFCQPLQGCFFAIAGISKDDKETHVMIL